MSGTITSSQAFTSLAVMSLLTNSLSILFTVIPIFGASLGCFDRIQIYLELQEIEKQEASVLEPLGTSTIGVEFQDMQEQQTQSLNEPLISLSNASFGSPPVLHNINLNLMSSSKTIITGPVACGKSLFLKALLGEVCASSGSVTSKVKYAGYCAQSSWLMNATVRDNITGMRSEDLEESFDNVWYNRVLHICCLEQDVAQFPEGDQLLVGSGGIRLSGGQKQRIVCTNHLLRKLETHFFQALARAINARKPIVILDDVFSGLDSLTCERIVERLLGPSGLFQELKTTVVIATHNGKHVLNTTLFGGLLILY